MLNRQGMEGRPILGRVAAPDFVGRGSALFQITGMAAGAARHEPKHFGLLVLAAPAAGASELLRQAYDLLFRERGGGGSSRGSGLTAASAAVGSPVYFALTRADLTTRAAARRFFQTFLVHVIAHRRRDPALLMWSPPIWQLIDLSDPSDHHWIERLVYSFDLINGAGDEQALVRFCFSAPHQAALQGAHSLVMIDDLHLADQLQGEAALGGEIAAAAARGAVPYVLAGLRRRLFKVLRETGDGNRLDRMTRLPVENLPTADAGALVERLAENLRVIISDEARDAVVRQCDGNPFYITSLMATAARDGVALTSFRESQRLYVDDLLRGGIKRRFDSLMERIAADAATRDALLRTLQELGAGAKGRRSTAVWRRQLNLDTDAFDSVIDELHAHEVVNYNTTFVEEGMSEVWRDYIFANYHLHVAGTPRALVVAQTLLETLKRAPLKTARRQNRSSGAEPREVLAQFNFQQIPSSLLDDELFGQRYRGLSSDEVMSGLRAETDQVQLPLIVNVAGCGSFFPPAPPARDDGRCVIAHGFTGAVYSDENEVVWLVVELTGAAAAEREAVEEWGDRLALLADTRGFRQWQLWFISGHGFSPEAHVALKRRGALSTSGPQLQLLLGRLGAESEEIGPASDFASSIPAAAVTAPAYDEYEMVIPVGNETELIAAHTLEMIARQLEFQPEAINQIKMALIEACLDAAEHEQGEDRKIYQRFRADEDKLVITVSSRRSGEIAPGPSAERGGALPLEPANGDNAPNASRAQRSWGLKLIRTLMDEVELERVADGTRLRMTKYIRR